MHQMLYPRTKRYAAALIALSLCACGGESARNDVSAPLQAAPAAPANKVIEFSGVRNNYAITRTTTGFSIRDLSSQAVVNVAAGASLKFSDMTVNLAIGEVSKTISATNLRSLIELYVAFFNRVPDADGMVYWIQQMNAGMSMNALANNFYTSAVAYPDLTGYSSNMTSAAFVKIIYKNVLGRSGDTAPPDEDVNYWAGELDSGRASKGSLVTAMLNSAHSYVGDATWGWVPQLLDNKITVGSYFSIEQGLGYVSDNDAITKGIAIASLVTATNISNARNLINVTDQHFSLLASSPTGSGKGNSRDCFNTDLFKPGATYSTEMITTIQSTGVTQSFVVNYSDNGTVDFKGNTVQELVADTETLAGIGVGTKSQMKSYVTLTNDELITYGTMLTIKLNTNTNYQVITTRTPTERAPLNLPVNQPYIQTYTVNQEVVGSSIKPPAYVSNDSITFLGIESISVPAGNFQACKMLSVNTDNGQNTSSYSWLIADANLRGLLAKVEADDAITVATKLSIKQ